jgi:UDP:flavonoid glycosyltransferase YjiC (YdhE family)
VSYFNRSLPHVKTISGLTDVGPVIKENGISVDIEKTLADIGKWIDSIRTIADNEYDLILKTSPDLIVSDISAMPFFAAHKAHVSSVGISNFSWSDVLKGFSNKQIAVLEEAYELADLAIQLPLGLDMKSFKNKKHVGLVCKKPTKSRKSIRERLGVRDSDLCVFINLGSYFKIKPTITNNVRIISTGAHVYTDNVVYIEPWIEGQDLVFASDLVVSKCGYGILSECLTNGIPFLYVSDDNHLEQKAISDELRKKGLENRILMDELSDLVLTAESISQINRIKEKNETLMAVNILNEMLR